MRLLLLLFFVGTPAFAQYKGPAVEVCRAYAKREIARDGTRAKDVIFEQDQELTLERYTRNVGSQFVSSILTGNGSVVIDGAPSAELSFICLLADDKRAVFFYWVPRRDAPALAQCRRGDGAKPGTPPRRPVADKLIHRSSACVADPGGNRWTSAPSSSRSATTRSTLPPIASGVRSRT